MPLSPPAPREHIHSRDITLRGYRREDGMWDIEAHLTDTKTYGFPNRERGSIEAGEPIHDMWLRLTLDDSMLIHDVEAATDYSPFGICGEITPDFKKLAGLTIGPGWTREARKRIGGVHGCTHLFELLGPIATVAYQTRVRKTNQADPGKKPGHLDTCHALATDGQVVKDNYPEFYIGD
jgi:hypothetical protein